MTVWYQWWVGNSDICGSGQFFHLPQTTAWRKESRYLCTLIISGLQPSCDWCTINSQQPTGATTRWLYHISSFCSSSLIVATPKHYTPKSECNKPLSMADSFLHNPGKKPWLFLVFCSGDSWGPVCSEFPWRTVHINLRGCIELLAQITSDQHFSIGEKFNGPAVNNCANGENWTTWVNAT